MEKLLTGSALFTIFASAFLHAQILNTKLLEEPALNEGQCHTLANSKVYLNGISDKMRAELGNQFLAQFQNTESESYFFCKIKCQLKSMDQFIWITRKDRNENFKNMNGFVCPGLDIQDVSVSQTLTIKTTVATPYLAVQSLLPEVHSLLTSISYKIPSSIAGPMIAEFYHSLSVIHSAYSQVTTGKLHDASVLLEKYSPEAPDAWPEAKKRSKQVNDRLLNNQQPSLAFESGEDFVDIFFSAHGRFLQYTD
ncbi:MAG: hypothetical protein JNL11_06985 [Bdellovibrionaceae bacterium]|nr:hypothetical protein [Pseudobdellovibrionaceae bacterium]